MRPIQTYAEFNGRFPARTRLRNRLRDAVVCALSAGRDIGRTSNWIRFPYYHHVFDDECRGFERQLDFLGGFGDFISLDDAISLLEGGRKFDGRYFCMTFDDGFKNNLTNALPILLEKKAPAAFFLTTGYIGSDSQRDRDKLLAFFDDRRTLMEFLNWDDCRALADAGMVIGSHTVSHARLAALDTSTVTGELEASKATIERELNRPCDHFCSPFGIPHQDYNVARDPGLVQAAGYKSMLTTERGPTRWGASAFGIRRDHTLANWSHYQLRYFLSLG